MPSLPLLFSRTKLTKIRGGPFLTHALRCSVALSWRIFRRLLKFVGWIFLILVRFVLVSVHQKWKIWVPIIGSSLFYVRCLKVFLVAVKSRAVDRSTIQFLTIFGVLLTAKICNQVSSLSLFRWRTLTLLKYKEVVCFYVSNLLQ